MKRRQFALAIATLLLLLPLSSCQNTKIQVEQQVGIQEAIALTYQEVQGKKTAEDDFVLYYYLDSCSGCQTFSPVLNEYIQAKNVVIYKYPYSSGTSGLDTIFGPKTPEVVPALLFIQDGKISSTIFYNNKTASIFTESEAFAQYMETKIKLPSIAWVSREDLSTMIRDDREFVVYFSLQGCGDCARLNQEFMN